MKMSDLAKLAGVSKSTVSRALAGSELINKDTCDLINKLAIEHGYKKDMRASNFRMKQVKTIGVMLPSDGSDNWLADNPFILEMLGAISDQFEMHGHELLLAKHSNSDPSWIINFIEARSVDGIIVLGQSIYHDILNEAASSCHNLVVWGANLPDQNYITVSTDNYLGGKLVAHHLLERGRKHFAFFGDTRCPETFQRYNGFCDAIEEAKGSTPLHINSIASQDNISKALDNSANDTESIDGLFASNDMQAINITQIIRGKGLDVPKDISVVGYDNTGLAKYTHPSLTSVHQDRKLAGKLLVEKLFALIRGEKVKSEMMATELMIRESS
ncbi:MAG: substrate-binding domain-containing protein [Gammaproteobacteria bacterium]|nr:substrate-binding domain-containing protein [Gammaproteobacteria bacterium]